MSRSAYALSLVTETRIAAKEDPALADLQRSAIEQLKIISGLRREEALRALLVGAQLLRIKESMPRGTWMPWIEENIKTGQRWVNYLMRLALIFFEKTRVSKPELLALPGDQAELALDGLHGAQRVFVEKAVKFVGDLSTSELLEKHKIKGTAKVGGAREKGEDAPEVLTPEQLAAKKKEELGEWLATGRQFLIHENVCQFLDEPAIHAFADSLNALRTEWRAGLNDLLKQAKAKAAPSTD
ncbi:MAG: hypothetical protein H7067_08125 [Burkholderiales bacterium]|nr:hypothetical protein [Opitutaceae bacterium]